MLFLLHLIKSMGTSTETFSKKEREKKKLKKQQDKKEKSNDRKTKAVKGQGLVDMMAYVDGNGNITSVPQEPGNRKKILAEDIQIGTPKQEEIEIETVRKGTSPFLMNPKDSDLSKTYKPRKVFLCISMRPASRLKRMTKLLFKLSRDKKGLLPSTSRKPIN